MNKKALVQLGQTIKMLREMNDYSQEDVAQHLNITRQAVGQIEQGMRKINSEELAKLAELLNAPIDSLLPTSQPITSRNVPTVTHDIPFNRERFRQLLLYILRQCGGKPNVGETVLYKLLYFCDFDSFETLGKPIAGMHYLRLQFGPVPKQDDFLRIIKEMISEGTLTTLTQQYHGRTQKRYIALAEPDLQGVSAEELRVIDKVLERLSDMNALQIEDYVHSDTPWKATVPGEVIDYNLVFQRTAPYAHAHYGAMWQDAMSSDVLKDLGTISEKEAAYYQNL